jgi:hypothetical protein
VTLNLKIQYFRSSRGTLAEFAPAFVVLLVAFLAILSAAQLLLYQMAAQKCCLDAAALAASSLTIKAGQQLVEQQANQFNSGAGKMLLLDNGKKPLFLQLTWTPVSIANNIAQATTDRYATVTGEIVIQPFCFPGSITLSSSAKCVLEHPEGWVPPERTSNGVQNY